MFDFLFVVILMVACWLVAVEAGACVLVGDDSGASVGSLRLAFLSVMVTLLHYFVKHTFLEHVVS